MDTFLFLFLHFPDFFRLIHLHIKFKMERIGIILQIAIVNSYDTHTQTLSSLSFGSNRYISSKWCQHKQEHEAVLYATVQHIKLKFGCRLIFASRCWFFCRTITKKKQLYLLFSLNWISVFSLRVFFSLLFLICFASEIPIHLQWLFLMVILFGFIVLYEISVCWFWGLLLLLLLVFVFVLLQFR